MSTARVLNPAMLSEFCKMRASPTTMGRNLPCSRQLNRIKRDLFGQANPVETQKIFAEELEIHQELATKKWGFDFRNGSPLNTNSQFIWERVSFQESAFAPEMYTLTRAAHSRPTTAEPSAYDMLMDERAERENLLSTSTDTDSCDESQDESTNVFKVPTVMGNCTGSRSTETNTIAQFLRKRQPKITEYMKERKRLAQTPKKVSPAKRMRTNSGSSISYTSSSATTTLNLSQSISAHFPLRSQRK